MLSLREEETDSQPESRDEDRRENSALSCHRSLQTHDSHAEAVI